MKRFLIPRDAPNAVVTPVPGHSVQLTNLDKVYFPEAGITKGDLLQYYADVAPLLIPYLTGRALVLKRYPGGIAEDFFYMKRTPNNAPAWLRKCSIEHGSGSVIDFPIVDDAAGLFWVINLGCIDLNEWYSRCDDTDRPDYLHFDLDPVEGTPFSTVRDVALRVRDANESTADRFALGRELIFGCPKEVLASPGRRGSLPPRARRPDWHGCSVNSTKDECTERKAGLANYCIACSCTTQLCGSGCG